MAVVSAMSWILLRDHLRADFERQIDHAILHHPDPELRALAATYVDRQIAEETRPRGARRP
jgi:hypothetical protein